MVALFQTEVAEDDGPGPFEQVRRDDRTVTGPAVYIGVVLERGLDRPLKFLKRADARRKATGNRFIHLELLYDDLADCLRLEACGLRLLAHEVHTRRQRPHVIRTGM